MVDFTWRVVAWLINKVLKPWNIFLIIFWFSYHMDVGTQSLARYLTDLKIKIIRSGTIREKRHENCRHGRRCHRRIFWRKTAPGRFWSSFIARGTHLAAIQENGLKVLSPTRDFTIHPELYPRFFIRFFIHAFVMEGKLSLIRLYFNGKWRE